MQRMLDAGDLRPVPSPQWLTEEPISYSGMGSSLAAVKEANLPAGSADFGSQLKEGASLAEQVIATAQTA